LKVKTTHDVKIVNFFNNKNNSIHLFDLKLAY